MLKKYSLILWLAIVSNIANVSYLFGSYAHNLALHGLDAGATNNSTSACDDSKKHTGLQVVDVKRPMFIVRGIENLTFKQELDDRIALLESLFLDDQKRRMLFFIYNLRCVKALVDAKIIAQNKELIKNLI
jgi:hypothetical protein